MVSIHHHLYLELMQSMLQQRDDEDNIVDAVVNMRPRPPLIMVPSCTVLILLLDGGDSNMDVAVVNMAVVAVDVEYCQKGVVVLSAVDTVSIRVL
jgi:hypothetical protein